VRNPDHFFATSLDGPARIRYPPRSMGETILVVDDEPDVVDLVRYHLHRAGFDVLIAFSGPAGLATATQSRPDAIVLDIMLPQMTGRGLQIPHEQ
jgi:CheY-like chemotaxis protein